MRRKAKLALLILGRSPIFHGWACAQGEGGRGKQRPYNGTADAAFVAVGFRAGSVVRKTKSRGTPFDLAQGKPALRTARCRLTHAVGQLRDVSPDVLGF